MSSSWSFEIETAVPAPRLFKAAGLDWHNLGPKIAPEMVSTFLIGGEGTIGSIRHFNFAPGFPFIVINEHLDLLDVEKFEAKTTLIEGGGLSVNVESATNHIKVEPKAGGSVVKVVGACTPLESMLQRRPKRRRPLSPKLLKAVRRTLLPIRPGAYN